MWSTFCPLALSAQPQPLGAFAQHQDVGTSTRAGSATYDATTQAYTLSSMGPNLQYRASDGASAAQVEVSSFHPTDIQLARTEIATGQREMLHSEPGSIQAPNWTRDDELIYNSAAGVMYTYDIATGTTHELETGNCRQNNNDRVLSFDGKMLALSNYTGQPRRYFNSLRTGTMQIWRMRPDGSSRAPIQHIEILEE